MIPSIRNVLADIPEPRMMNFLISTIRHMIISAATRKIDALKALRIIFLSFDEITTGRDDSITSQKGRRRTIGINKAIGIRVKMYGEKSRIANEIIAKVGYIMRLRKLSRQIEHIPEPGPL